MGQSGHHAAPFGDDLPNPGLIVFTCNVLQTRIGTIVVALAVFAVAGTALAEVNLFARFEGFRVVRRWRVHQRTVHRIFLGGDVHDALFIHRCAAPLCPTISAGEKEGALATHGNEGLSGVGFGEFSDDFGAVGGKTIDVFGGEGLPGKGFWPQGERLGGCRLFTWNCRGWNGAFFDWEQRFARHPVKHKHESLFAQNRHRVDLFPVLNHCEQIRWRRDVPIPDIVVHGLEMPKSFAGFGVQGDEAIGKKVVALAVAAIKIKSRRTSGSVYNASFGIHGHAHPVVGSANVFVVFFLPGVVTIFAGVGDGVKGPDFAASPNVICPNVALQSCGAFGYPRTHDEDVLINRSRGVSDHVIVGPWAGDAVNQVDSTIFAKGRNDLSRFGI